MPIQGQFHSPPNSLSLTNFSPAMVPSSDNFHDERSMYEKREFVVSTSSPDNGECVEKEKQISVDPISLRPSSARESSAREDMISVPVIASPDIADLHLPPPLPPSQFKFLSYSLPNSVNSSPRFGSVKKRWKIENRESKLKVSNSTMTESSEQDVQIALQEETQFRRSKSCGEGRVSAPSDDLDLWLNKGNFPETKSYVDFSRTESDKDNRNSGRNLDPTDDGFKCGALCLFLPGFSKAKVVRSIRKEEEPEIGKGRLSRTEIGSVISRTVSLEKFECGSWASPALPNGTGGDDDSSSSLFYDLPLELIRNSVDADAPVTAAFLFDKDQKGVSKNSSTKSVQKSHDSSHHVRFSASSSSSGPSSLAASCITPRLRKAREEFNAFLEAQSSA